ncbi:hypothetical protein NA56DRAFT_700829 [Hyaloscypha hepaticicola]|uniref:Uncharacterized protein n=1 Tax=Hyaloscypha hepaticicola TaxID=2082293 RepID=A0A2J6QDK1_9HELO|nr:hypothetical protein NA56DRAFT_700829 [Hyaloscypha hepaticicola]
MLSRPKKPERNLKSSQRAMINGILAYSMEIKIILDNIIGDGAEDGEDYRSHASDVDSFYSLGTEQSEDLQSDDGSSVINSNLVRVSAELKEQEPVIKRCAAIEKRILRTTPNMAAIHAGNAAVHQGNWRVDIILAKRGLLTPDNVSKLNFWHCKPSTESMFPNLIIDMMDMNATMRACLAGTAYTHDKVLQDSFDKSCRFINDLYKDAVQKHPGDWQAASNTISSNPRTQLVFAKIKRICVEFETKQRYGIHHRGKVSLSLWIWTSL